MSRDRELSTEEGSLKILASRLSPSGRYFVTCDDYKQLSLWAINGDNSWTRLSTRSLVRRATSLMFTSDDCAVLVADKSGDVYRFAVQEKAIGRGQLVLGHVSMLLDLVLMSSDKFLATSDRDEKIRVSRYPNAYSIHCYCLGHTDFVSQLVYLEDEDVIVSGSGDGTLRVWDYKTGREVSVTDCRPHLRHRADSPDPDNDGSSPDGGQERGRHVEGVDLKRLVHCRRHRLLVVGFDRLQVLLLYKYTPSPSNGHSVALTFIQEVLLNGSFWDMTFDTEGQLWVLQAYEDRPLEVYQINSPDGQLVPLGTYKHAVLTSLSAIRNKWHLFKDCLHGGGLFSVLHKTRVDNAQFYHERKRQRLEELKRRRKEKTSRRAEVATSSDAADNHRAGAEATPGE